MAKKDKNKINTKSNQLKTKCLYTIILIAITNLVFVILDRIERNNIGTSGFDGFSFMNFFQIIMSFLTIFAFANGLEKIWKNNNQNNGRKSIILVIAIALLWFLFLIIKEIF